MADGKAVRKYKKYINSLNKDPAVNIAIAIQSADGSFAEAKAQIFTKKEIASTQNDEHFVLNQIIPALRQHIIEVIREYKKKNKSESFTSDILGEDVVQKLTELGKEVQKELAAKEAAKAPVSEPTQGFIGK